MAAAALVPTVPPVPTAAAARPRRRPGPKDPVQGFIVTFVMVAITAAFLSPLVQAFTVSIKTPEQLSQARAPIWPATPRKFEYQGEQYDVYQVPIDGTVRSMALVEPRRTRSQFIDPANPDAGLVDWVGSWRTLEPAWEFDPQWGNYAKVWDVIDFPKVLFNTFALAILGTVGTLVSCTLVAYGFARFRFPGRDSLFMLLIATVFLPGAVTLIPTYMIWVKSGIMTSDIPFLPWAPLLIPTFLANAYDVFLLRQFLMTIPRDLDDAAAIDGAGPLRTLVSVVLPQAWPAVVAVGIFHFVYTWNDFFGPLIYLSTHMDLQPVSVALSRFSGVYYTNPAFIQAGTLMTLFIPVILFVVFQRIFTRGIVLTGVEK
ncbi:MAG TPA: carbohydrate ABC transporter permease [Candidatus Limnocylindrales bacterium]|nr:carbohydrate ABC transporter permease [Candidatus Limnocylindrales bacterium]